MVPKIMVSIVGEGKGPQAPPLSRWRVLWLLVRPFVWVHLIEIAAGLLVWALWTSPWARLAFLGAFVMSGLFALLRSR